MNPAEMPPGEKKIGAFSKVALWIVIKKDNQELLPVRYSEATDSLNLLSTSRIIPDKNAPTPEFNDFRADPKQAFSEIQAKYLNRKIETNNLEQLYDTEYSEFLEPFGTVKGIKQNLHYRGYAVREALIAADFKENVLFIHLSELKEKLLEAKRDGLDLNEINIEISGKTYRLDRGITYTFEEYERKHEIYPDHS